MADKKISQLTAASTPLAGTEVLPIVQSSTTVKVAVNDLTAGRSVAMDNLTVGQATTSATNYSITLTGSNAAANGTWILGKRNNSNAWYIGDTAAALGSGSGFIHYIYGANPYLVYCNGSQVWGIDGGTGNATLSVGNLIQGTAAKGVNFTANTPAAGMTSQLLNWYEEGTWTPSLGGNATYTTRLARYVRVGKQVTVSFVIQVNAIGTGSTTTISGLPFAVANNNQYHNAGSLAYFDSLAISVVSIVPRAVWNTSTMDFTVLTAAATASTTTAAIFQNGTYLIGNVTYLVD